MKADEKPPLVSPSRHEEHKADMATKRRREGGGGEERAAGERGSVPLRRSDGGVDGGAHDG